VKRPRDRKSNPRDTLAKQTKAVYERLLQGPATEPQLRAYSRSRRVAARVYDLNQTFAENRSRLHVAGGFVNGSRLYQYRIVRKGASK